MCKICNDALKSHRAYKAAKRIQAAERKRYSRTLRTFFGLLRRLGHDPTEIIIHLPHANAWYRYDGGGAMQKIQRPERFGDPVPLPAPTLRILPQERREVSVTHLSYIIR